MSDQPAIAEDGAVGKLILVVDDEFDVLSAFSMLFEYRGFRVLTAANGREALAVAERERPDIVISDYMMPVMDGAAFCLAWRADPRFGAIPFILTSAGLLRDDLDIPCDAFFRKPVTLELLYREITRLLGQAAPE